MAKTPSFPVEIKAGGSVLRILLDPVKIKNSTPATGGPAGQKAAAPKATTYDSYVVEYYVGKQRTRIRRNSYADALAEADRIRVQLLNADVDGLQLTGVDRRAYLSALELLSANGKPLDHVVKEYVDAMKVLQPLGMELPTAMAQFSEAKQRLGDTPLTTAVEFFDRHGRAVKHRRKVPEVVTEFLAGLKADGSGQYHIRDMEIRLGRFSTKFPGDILDVTSEAITDWLRGLRVILSPKKSDGAAAAKNRMGAPLGPKTRNHYRNAVVQLFNFARERHYLPSDLKSAAEVTKTVKVVNQENEIFPPEDMEKLLRNAPAHLIPGMAIKAFAGVRTEELAKIKWSDIRFDQDHIKLAADVTKLQQRRLIHLHPNLKAWLLPHRQAEGRICERWRTPNSVFQAWDRYAVTQGIHVGENKFRNSFISYRLAETRDINQVALESGNSPEVIRREYLEVTTQAEALKWFGILPAAGGGPPPQPKT